MIVDGPRIAPITGKKELMDTKLSSATKEIVVSPNNPTVLIGERINPTGKKKMAEALAVGDIDYLLREALSQVEAGADLLDVNVGVSGLDEAALMARAVEKIISTVDLPLCLDSDSSKALRAGLDVYQGKPLINSVNAKEESLEEILPLAKEYGAAVIGLPIDEKGIPTEPAGRLDLALKIVERAEKHGISREDIVFDSLAMSIGADPRAGLVTLETIHLISMKLGLNQTLGVSNVSFGIPDRHMLNGSFLTMAIHNGVNCPVVDVAQVREVVLGTDLALGRDEYAQNYLTAFRQRQDG